ncbi:hypothetical protein C8F04DRAFT_918571, partial [Mycena alexandri]
DHPPVPFREVNLPQKLRFRYHTNGKLHLGNYRSVTATRIMKASPACIREMKKTADALQLAGHRRIQL